MKQWDVESGKLTLRLAGHEGWVWHVEALDEGQQCLLSSGTDASVRVWDCRAGKQAQRADLCAGERVPGRAGAGGWRWEGWRQQSATGRRNPQSICTLL